MAVVGAFAYQSQSKYEYAKNWLPRNKGDLNNEEFDYTAFQIHEDIDFGIFPKANMSLTNNVLVDEEIGGIIRSDQYSDIYNIRDNALDFTNKARLKNKYLGEINFRPDTKATILLPNYGTVVSTPMIPNPEVMPGYAKIPGAYLDKPFTSIRLDQQPWLYKDPYGEEISPYNRPVDMVHSVYKFGNPWGPGGIFNIRMRTGGDRLEKTHDYDPTENHIKRVSFQIPNGGF